MLTTMQYNNPQMQLYTRDYSIEQPANGYKFFLKDREKTLRPSNAEASKKQDKNHKQTTKQTLVRKTEMTYSKIGFPSRVASSVVQDNAPNNLGLGLPTYSVTCRQFDF